MISASTSHCVYLDLYWVLYTLFILISTEENRWTISIMTHICMVRSLDLFFVLSCIPFLLRIFFYRLWSGEFFEKEIIIGDYRALYPVNAPLACRDLFVLHRKMVVDTLQFVTIIPELRSGLQKCHPYGIGFQKSILVI